MAFPYIAPLYGSEEKTYEGLSMLKFILKKIVYGILILWGVLTAVFFIFNVLPGDPARMVAGQMTDKNSLNAIRKDLGLDKSLGVQYVMYLNDLSFISIFDTEDPENSFYLDTTKYSSYLQLFPVSGSKDLVIKLPYLRRSYISQRKVSEIIAETMPETAVLAFAATLFASFLGIFVGVISALKKNSWFDRMSLVFAVMGMSGPSFFIGLIVGWLFGYVLTDYTGLSNIGSLFTQDEYGNGEYLDLKNLILPGLTLGVRPLAIVIQLMRSSLLDVLSQDYIRTAKAKGLSLYRIIIRHALKNALNPVVTSISGWFAGLMAGAVFVEIVFSWKGIGYEVFYAIQKNDLPVVMGATLIFATIFVVINTIVDIAYGMLDPRVRIQ